MLVSQSPLAVDRRECQEAAVADSLTCPSPSRSETSQKLRCLSYAPGHLNLTFTSLLISSFLQSPVLVSLLHCKALCLLKRHHQNSFSFLLCFIFSSNPCFGFFTRWSSFSTCGIPHLSLLSLFSLSISLWCCLQSSWSSLPTTVSFSFLLVSYFYCLNHWYCPINLFPELAVLLQTDLCPLRFPVLSFVGLALRLLSIQLKLNICLTYFACYASQQAFSVFRKGWIICSSFKDSPAQWHT